MCSLNSNSLETHRSKSKGMPLEVSNRRDIDEDVLASLGVESFPPHLNLDGLRWMLHHLHNNHLVEAADETHNFLYGVDDEASHDKQPGLEGGGGGGVGGWKGRGQGWEEGVTGRIENEGNRAKME